MVARSHHKQHGFTLIGHRAKRGFTFIELTIVLVIISLVIGSVLVSHDMLASAAIRSEITQIDRLNADANAFHTKYNGLPGDLLETTAATLGFYDSGSTATGTGNGDGLITDSNAANVNAPVGETVMFWRHLTDAGLINGAYGVKMVNLSGGVLVAPLTPQLYFPQAKAGQNAYIIVGSSNSMNYYGIIGLTGVTAATYNPAAGLSPTQAFQIDTKMDDGLPNMGVVQARGTASTAGTDGIFPALSATDAALWAAPANLIPGDCLTTGASATDTTDTYATAGTATANVLACNLLIRAAF